MQICQLIRRCKSFPRFSPVFVTSSEEVLAKKKKPGALLQKRPAA